MMEKAAKSGQITPRQREFAEYYFLKHYIDEAARAMDISERTGRRWFALPQVRVEIERLQQERREEIQRKSAECMDLAIDFLHSMLSSAMYPGRAGARYAEPERIDKYISLLFKYAQDQREIDALKVRVAQLEAAQEQIEPQAIEGTVTRLPARRTS
jgi:hypothetical protein